MKYITGIAGKVALLAFAVLIAGCSLVQAPTPVALPTQDLNIVRTEAVSTVVAALTQDALANPSPTPVPPSATVPPPTATAPSLVLSTPTKVLILPTATRTSGGGGGGGGGVVVPSKTPYTDSCKLVSTKPYDYQVLVGRQDFDAVWTVKNVGMRAWTANSFYIKYLSGEQMNNKSDMYYLENNVAVNDSVQLVVDMIAPGAAGTYVANWALVNDDGVAFCKFFVAITI